jgi:hypothetical protein
MSISINPDDPSQSGQSQEALEGAAAEPGAGAEEISGGGKTADGMSSHSDWRALARKIEEEKDHSKVIELAQQLIAMIDAKKLDKSPRREP